MSTILNYAIEANIGLILFMAFYLLVLRNETNFRFKRLYLISGIVISLTSPLLTINLAPAPISVFRYAIPDVISAPSSVVGNAQVQSAITSFGYVDGLWSMYGLISFILLGIFLIRLIRLIIFITKASIIERRGNCLILAGNQKIPTFSFFHFIFPGNADLLPVEERERTIQHEIIHARKFHSIDILFIELVKVFFWFNPTVYLLKKNITAVHEFEADHLSVVNQNVDEYCSLLAKVALMNVKFPLTNQFGTPMTLERISMLRKIKSNLSLQKIVLTLSVMALFFVSISCQDIIAGQSRKISTASVTLPGTVNQVVQDLQKKYPNSKFVTIERSLEPNEELQKIWKRADVGLITSVPVVGMSNNRMVQKSFMIIEFTDRFIKSQSSTELQIDEHASPIIGIEEFYHNLNKILVYPNAAIEDAKPYSGLIFPSMNKSIEGNVEVGITIGADGSVLNVEIVRGLYEPMDAEAIRAIYALATKWKPATSQGKAVQQKVILPVVFSRPGC